MVYLLSIWGLHAERPEENIVWGRQTNGVSIGVFNDGGNIPAQKALLLIWLTNSSSSRLVFVIPEVPFRFDVSLFDSKRAPVPRTTSGASIGKQIASIRRLDEKQFGQLKRVFPLPMDLTVLHRDKINLFDYFKITKPGIYRLFYEQRLQTPVDRYTLKAVVCPKVETEMEISDGISNGGRNESTK